MIRNLVLTVAAMLICSSAAWAQEDRDGDRDDRRRQWRERGGDGGRDREEDGGERGGRRGGGRGRGGRGGWRGGGDFFARMDANQNGMIDPDEVNDRNRRMIEGAARYAGLDASKPIPLDKLTGGRGRGGDRDGERRDGEQPAEKSAPLVPGFGVDSTLPAVPGFGVEVATASTPGAASSSPAAAAAPAAASPASGGSGTPSDAEKVRRYAESLLKQYDANKNGKLEEDEWTKMRGDPEKADTNGDKVVTLDELSARMAGFASRGNDNSGDAGDGGRQTAGSGSPSPRSSSSGSQRRFLTVSERLPKGLPDWFARSDVDGDGQVSMAEYTTSWSDSKLAEFNRYDANGDGMLTPRECVGSSRDN